MSSSKRSLSDFYNKDEFNYYINDGKIYFPQLFSRMNNSLKIRFWEIYCYIDGIDIDIDMIDINKFKEMNIIENAIIQTEYGLLDGKLTLAQPTIIDSGKNINKINETSVITQAIINMRSLYLKKIKSGYQLSIDDESPNVYPMAIQTYTKYKHKIKFPCRIQAKLDGIRLTASLDNNGEVILLSRRLHKIYGFDNIKDEVRILLKDNPKLILDGELYNHNMDLQTISGITRDENKFNPEKNSLKFYIFDCFSLEDNFTFEERYNRLLDINKNISLQLNYIVILETVTANSEKDGDELFDKYVNDGYEGIIYKNKDAPYEWSSIKEKRTMDMIKRKKAYSEEFEIVDYSDGIGKFKEMIIFTLKTKEGKLFNSVPLGSADYRKNLYSECVKDFSKYKGKLSTVKFDEYSKDNIPLRSNIVQVVRDMDFD